jgi:hypothetical protein
VATGELERVVSHQAVSDLYPLIFGPGYCSILNTVTMEESDFYQEIPLPECDERLVAPFEHVEVPDDATLVSAITHESNALFVTSMYPSVESIGHDHDHDHPHLKPLPPLVENEEEQTASQASLQQSEAQVPSLQQSEAAALKGVQGKGISKEPRHENQTAMYENEEPPYLSMKATLKEDKLQEGDEHNNPAVDKASSVNPLPVADDTSLVASIPGAFGVAGPWQAPNTQNNGHQAAPERLSQVSAIPGAYGVDHPGQDPGMQNMGLQVDTARPSPPPAALDDNGSESDRAAAVAIPVDEDDELIPKQTATPANERGPLARKNSQQIYSCAFLGALLVISGIVVGSICGSGLCSNPSATQSSTEAPTTFRDMLAHDIQQNLEASLGFNYFMDKSQSPHILAQRQKALEWMVHADPLQLEPDADNLLQRFVLVAFYYLTSQQKPWTSCIPPNGTQGDTCILSPFYHSEEVYGTRWLSGSSECEWAGVFCYKGGVVDELYLRKFFPL